MDAGDLAALLAGVMTDVFGVPPQAPLNLQLF
jgi:hypothetical protein